MKKHCNKSVITNITAVVIIVIGYIFSAPFIKSIGFFALSGAITNWLAIYMLFEKVPYLYGSGVIPDRFEEFKLSIKQLMMEQISQSLILNSLLKKKNNKVENYWIYSPY